MQMICSPKVPSKQSYAEMEDRLLRLYLFVAIFVLSAVSLLYVPFSQAEDIEIERLLIDETITRMGHEFYLHFTKAWGEPKYAGAYNLVIGERPSARWGSLIWITSDSLVVFRTTMRPGRNHIKQEALSSVPIVHRNLRQLILLQNSNQYEKDIARDGY